VNFYEILWTPPVFLDWLTERVGLEASVSREVLLKENGLQCWRSFASELRWNPRENEYRCQFGTIPDFSLQFGCRENAAGKRADRRRRISMLAYKSAIARL